MPHEPSHHLPSPASHWTPTPPPTKHAPSRAPGTSPAPPTLLDCPTSLPLLITLFRRLCVPSRPWLCPVGPPKLGEGSHPSLWLLCGPFLPWPLNRRDPGYGLSPSRAPDSWVQLATQPTASPPGSIQSPKPIPLGLRGPALTQTSGASSPPTSHPDTPASHPCRLLALLSSQTDLHSLSNGTSPSTASQAASLGPWARVWHSRSSPMGTCWCTLRTPDPCS